MARGSRQPPCRAANRDTARIAAALGRRGSPLLRSGEFWAGSQVFGDQAFAAGLPSPRGRRWPRLSAGANKFAPTTTRSPPSRTPPFVQPPSSGTALAPVAAEANNRCLKQVSEPRLT